MGISPITKKQPVRKGTPPKQRPDAHADAGSLLRTDILHVSACMVLFLIAVALIHPVLEMGMNDDWEYVFTARELASSGKLVYNLSSIPLFPQAYWAALFIKLFGFSFSIVRLSAVALIVICIPGLYALAREAGLRPKFASFAVLTCVLSPLFVPNAVTFMTDGLALCFAMISLLGFIRAWKTASTPGCVAWMAAASIAGVLAGCTRQTYWLLSFTCLATIAYLKWRRRDGAASVFAGLLLLVSIGTGFAVLRWFRAQPHSFGSGVHWPHRSLVWLGISSFSSMVRIVDTCVLLLIPVLIFYVVPSTRLFSKKAWLAGALITSGAFVIYEFKPSHWPPRLGDIVTQYGFLGPGFVALGNWAVVLTPVVRLGLAAIMFATAAAFLGVSVCKLRQRDVLGSWQRQLWPFVALSFPFAVMCVMVLISRTWNGLDLFDRYLLFLLPILSIPTLWLYQTSIEDRVPAVGWIALFIFASYAAATMHDAFALSNARLRASEEVRRSGVPRSQIMGGIEYDSWTEIALAGHIGDGMPIENCNGPKETQIWFRPFFPSLRQRYFVVTSRLAGLVDAPFAPVAYRTWLPPFRGEVFTQMLPDGSAIYCQ